MKAAHHKTIWYHSAYAVVMAALLAVLLIVSRNLPVLIIVLLVALYVGGHIYLHIKRDDLKPETIVEYSLLGAAVCIVLAGALR